MQIVREDGIEISRTIMDAEIIYEPQLHILEVGTGDSVIEVR
jgi:uncharacterized protein YabE (DUF348 family)